MRKFLITLTFVSLFSLGVTVHAETVEELKQRQTELNNEREEIKSQLSEAEAEIADVLIELRDLNEEIARVDEALRENKRMMRETTKEISETEEEIDELEEEIEALNEQIEERYELLKKRATSMQKSGGKWGFLEVIFGAKSFGEFISRTSAVNTIATNDIDLMEQQEEDKAKVEAQQTKVEEKLAQLTEMKEELEGMQILIADQQKANEEKKETLQNKESELKALKADLETEDSRLASLEQEIRRDIATARQSVATRTPSSNETTNHRSLQQLSDDESNTSHTQPVRAKGDVQAIINAGRSVMGAPYVWAGKGPNVFDCSGFVSWAFRQAGYSIPSSTSGLASTGTKISYSQIQPGDLVFFDTYKRNGHVGIYIGNGQFIGAQNTTGVAIASMSNTYWKKTFNGHVRRVR